MDFLNFLNPSSLQFRLGFVLKEIYNENGLVEPVNHIFLNCPLSLE